MDNAGALLFERLLNGLKSLGKFPNWLEETKKEKLLRKIGFPFLWVEREGGFVRLLTAVPRACKLARMANVNKLYVNGYKNFILFNLPDLSKTPRYQRASEKERSRLKK